MPAITYTANAGTDQLTATAHGLVTGDGPVVVRKGTTATVLAAPLAEVTEYWAIRIDNNTLQLATSQANALASTFVPLTTAGSGTQILEYGLPYIRPRTYVPNVGGPGTPTPGSQIRSADFNSEFASWTNLHRLLTGQSQSVWTGINNASKYYHSSVETLVYTWPRDFVGAYTLNALTVAELGIGFSGSNAVLCGLDLPVGRTIVGARADVQDAASTTLTASIVRRTTGGSHTIYQSLASAGSAARQTLNINQPAISLAVTTGAYYFVAVQFTTGSTASRFFACEIDLIYPVP